MRLTKYPILNQKNVSKIAKSFNIGGTNVTCAREITEKFNEYFTNVGRNLASTIPVSQKSFKNYIVYLKIPTKIPYSSSLQHPLK